jgi:hypothetical protein
MKWLKCGNHAFWVVLGIVLTRSLFQLFMPLFMPENSNTYKFVTDDTSLSKKNS